MDKDKELIIYNTPDGRTKVSLMAKDGKVWMNQQGIAELFGTSKPNISMHMSNVFKDRELEPDQVVKQYLTTASDCKNYLAADEIDTLNRLVVVFLETAELRVKERNGQKMFMRLLIQGGSSLTPLKQIKMTSRNLNIF